MSQKLLEQENELTAVHTREDRIVARRSVLPPNACVRFPLPIAPAANRCNGAIGRNSLRLSYILGMPPAIHVSKHIDAMPLTIMAASPVPPAPSPPT